MYVPLKAKPPKKEAKKAEVKPKGKKKDEAPLSPDYIALMEVICSGPSGIFDQRTELRV